MELPQAEDMQYLDLLIAFIYLTVSYLIYCFDPSPALPLIL